jgi:hypothetical protein
LLCWAPPQHQSSNNAAPGGSVAWLVPGVLFCLCCSLFGRRGTHSSSLQVGIQQHQLQDLRAGRWRSRQDGAFGLRCGFWTCAQAPLHNCRRSPSSCAPTTLSRSMVRWSCAHLNNHNNACWSNLTHADCSSVDPTIEDSYRKQARVVRPCPLSFCSRVCAIRSLLTMSPASWRSWILLVRRSSQLCATSVRFLSRMAACISCRSSPTQGFAIARALCSSTPSRRALLLSKSRCSRTRCFVSRTRTAFP